MKILFATRSIFPDSFGGSSRFNKNLLLELSNRKDIEITIINPIKNKHFENIKLFKEIYINYGENINQYSKNIDTFLKNKTFDILFSDGLSLHKCKNINGAQIIFHHHGYHMFQKQYFGKLLFESPKEFVKEFILFSFRKRAVKKFARKADYSISLGSGISEILKNNIGLESNKVVEIPNAVYKTEENVSNEKIENSFLFVGSLCFRKGVSLLESALCNISEDFKFYFVGGGPLLKRLQNKFKHNDKIEVLGRISDEELFELYSKVECFCFPSLQEGLPTVILEAMEKGLPIITTDIGATKDVIDNNGFLIEKGNTSSIIKAIRDFIALPENKKIEMSRNSRRIIEQKFTWELVTREFYKLLQKLSEGKNEK
ncbi:MAG: glycosyltransferase family 4 protein [bacterium]